VAIYLSQQGGKRHLKQAENTILPAFQTLYKEMAQFRHLLKKVTETAVASNCHEMPRATCTVKRAVAK